MFVFVLAMQCSKYVCSDHEDDSACIVYNATADTYSLDPCRDTTQTCIPTHDQQDVYCIDFNSHTPTSFSYPGEHCYKIDDCVYGQQYLCRG
jgi:hypothetical protein